MKRDKRLKKIYVIFSLQTVGWILTLHQIEVEPLEGFHEIFNIDSDQLTKMFKWTENTHRTSSKYTLMTLLEML